MASSSRKLSLGDSWVRLPRPLLLSVAMFFCILTTVYAVVWMYDARAPESLVELGFNKSHDEEYDKRTHSIPVADVVPGSPADKAGLREGDHITRVNGMPLATTAPWDEVYARSRPGDAVEVTVERRGAAEPMNLHGVFRARSSLHGEGLAKSSAQRILNLFPVLFLLVGFGVLFLRTDDPHAWLLALMFSAFAAAPNFRILWRLRCSRGCLGSRSGRSFMDCLRRSSISFSRYFRCGPYWIASCPG